MGQELTVCHCQLLYTYSVELTRYSFRMIECHKISLTVFAVTVAYCLVVFVSTKFSALCYVISALFVLLFLVVFDFDLPH